jgi:DNA-binding transcriptional regulator YiaG
VTQNEFREVLAKMKLSQRAAARWLEVDDRTVRRWCSKGGAPRMAEYALRWAFDEMKRRGL